MLLTQPNKQIFGGRILMEVMRRRGRITLAAAIVTVIGLGACSSTTLAGSGDTSEDDVGAAALASLTLNYSCVFPLIGAQPLSVEISSDIPTEVTPGVPTGAFEIDAISTVNDAARVGLRTVGATTLEGTVKADAHLAAPSLDLPLVVDMAIPQAPIPATAGAFTVNADGATPSLTFTAQNAGTGTITVGDLVLTMTPRDANGNPTGLGTFDADCTAAPGQDQVLHTFTITGGSGTTTTSVPGSTTSTTLPSTTTTTVPQPLEFAFDLTGSSFIQAANGTTPLTGGIVAQFDLATGTHTSELTLAPTTGSFTILGILPVTASIEFVQAGPTTGSLVDGRLTSRSEMFVRLTNVLAFGYLPIGGGPTCQTTTPAVVDLATPAGELFDPLAGGNLEGTYTLPGLAAGSCGFLGDLISLFTAGPNNTIDLALTATD